MLKRLGLAGLLFATLAVTPLTVAAQDRDDHGFRNTRETEKTHYIQATRFDSRDRDNRSRNENRFRNDDRDRDANRFRDNRR